MTGIDRDIRAAILRALLAAKGAMPEAALKEHVNNLFSVVAMSDGDLMQHFKALQEAQFISGTNDPLVGMMWDLTPTGKIRAQQLR